MVDTLEPADGELFDARMYEQYCYACGVLNENGLHLRFRRDGAAGVTALYRPKETDQGFPGVLHGGVAAALLDEVMAWSMYAAQQVIGMTAKMETHYRQPVSLGEPLTVRGQVTRSRGRRLEVRATIEDGVGACLVEADGLFLRLPAAEEAGLLRSLGWPAGDRAPD